jgi:hypothetical protein
VIGRRRNQAFQIGDFKFQRDDDEGEDDDRGFMGRGEAFLNGGTLLRQGFGGAGAANDTRDAGAPQVAEGWRDAGAPRLPLNHRGAPGQSRAEDDEQD